MNYSFFSNNVLTTENFHEVSKLFVSLHLHSPKGRTSYLFYQSAFHQVSKFQCVVFNYQMTLFHLCFLIYTVTTKFIIFSVLTKHYYKFRAIEFLQGMELTNTFKIDTYKTNYCYK